MVCGSQWSPVCKSLASLMSMRGDCESWVESRRVPPCLQSRLSRIYLKSGRSRPLQLWPFPAKTSARWLLLTSAVARSPACTSLCDEGGTIDVQKEIQISLYHYNIPKQGPKYSARILHTPTWTPRYPPPTVFVAREGTSPILCLGVALLAPWTL